MSSGEDSLASDGVHIAGQSPLATTPAMAEYGVFSTSPEMARPLL